MLPLFLKFWSRRHNLSHRPPTPKRPRVLLNLETLEDRTVPQGNFSGTVTGVAFIDAFNTPTYSLWRSPIARGSRTLVGNARFTGTAVDDTATTNGNGVFTFQNVLPGTYRLSSSAVPGLHYSSVNIGGVVPSSSTRTGSPFAASRRSYRHRKRRLRRRTQFQFDLDVAIPDDDDSNEFHPAGAGSGQRSQSSAVDYPTVSHPIANQTVSVNTPPPRLI